MAKQRIKINRFLLKYELSRKGSISYNPLLSVLDIDRNALNYCFRVGFEQNQVNAICNYLGIREEKIL